ncbi:hypothetical protein [Glycomyces salinus]|uniref:hypothetical protein n=1 Tax=Glycomyces salinus TaxID=980294 RepID=UPI0018EAB495|nr:hypothetical protein [Glycomyces salinus]
MYIGRPLLRGFRALVFAVVCVAVSVALHVVAGGALITSGAFATAVAALVPLAFLLGGGQRGVPTLLAACAVAQSGLHLWFTADAGHAGHLMPSPTMLLVHALAAAVSAVWLARGDAALAAFCDFLVLLFGPALRLRLLGALEPVLPPRPAAAAPPLPRPQLELLASAASLRGPPARSLSR